jgi:hydrid cluster protein-associated redox disulfide domain
MITGDMTITEIVEKYPKTADVLLSYGMHCFGCMAARYENLEQGALAHGIDVPKLLKDLNSAVGTH